MLTKTVLFFLAALATLTGFTVTAHAASVVDSIDGHQDIVQAVYSALTGGHYAYVAALALVGGVALVRKSGGARFPVLHTDAGSAILVLGGSFGTAMAAALAGGGPVTFALVKTSGLIAFVAAGGYGAVNALIVKPYIVPLAAKAPSWLQLPFQAILFWFQHKSDPALPVATVVSGGNTPPASSAK